MKNRRLTWGGFLILLGVLFLLDALNIINFNIWGLFWPLLLILLGLQILMRSRTNRTANYQEHLAIPIKEIERAHVHINYGAGELVVNSNSPPENLLEGDFGELDYDVKKSADGADITLRSPSGEFFIWDWWREADGRNWNFGLNNAIPLSLDVKSGASRTVLDLADLNVKELHLRTGASETIVTLPAHATHTRVTAKMGMASLNLNVPDGVAARIHTSGGLSDIRVDRKRFPRNGNKYESPDYKTADNKVDIDLTVGMGSARIR